MPDRQETRLRWLRRRTREEILGSGRLIGPGGWTELVLTLALLWQAAIVWQFPQTLWDAEALRPFLYAQVTSTTVAAVPAGVGALCLLGMIIGWTNRDGIVSWWMRALGMALQLPCWAWLVIASYHVGGMAQLALPVYVLVCFLGAFRVLALICAEEPK